LPFPGSPVKLTARAGFSGRNPRSGGERLACTWDTLAGVCPKDPTSRAEARGMNDGLATAAPTNRVPRGARPRAEVPERKAIEASKTRGNNLIKSKIGRKQM